MLSDGAIWARLAENSLGMAILGAILYKLLDKWAGKFLEAQRDQTAALTAQSVAMTSQSTSIGELVKTIRDGQSDQHEVLLAVRSMSRQMEQMKEVMDERA